MLIMLKSSLKISLKKEHNMGNKESLKLRLKRDHKTRMEIKEIWVKRIIVFYNRKVWKT